MEDKVLQDKYQQCSGLCPIELGLSNSMSNFEVPNTAGNGGGMTGCLKPKP